MSTNDKGGEAIATIARLRAALVKHITNGNPLAREMQQWRNDLCDVEDSLRAAAPSADLRQLNRDAIMELVESYFKRVRKLGGDTGECSAAGIADWLLWQKETENFAATATLSSARPSNGATPRTDAAEAKAEMVLAAYRRGPLTDEGLASALVAVTRILLTESRGIERDLATPSATSQHKDEARLLWLDTLLRHCPHAELTYNDDEDDGSVGFRLVVESCTRLDLQAPTLDALIDLGIRTSPDEDGDVVARSEGRDA